jgi:hypothetical protein
MDSSRLSLELFALAALLRSQDGPLDEEAALGLGYLLEELAGEAGGARDLLPEYQKSNLSLISVFPALFLGQQVGKTEIRLRSEKLNQVKS